MRTQAQRDAQRKASRAAGVARRRDATPKPARTYSLSIRGEQELEAEADEARREAYAAWQAGGGGGLDDLTLRAAAQHAQTLGDASAERAVDGELEARAARR